METENESNKKIGITIGVIVVIIIVLVIVLSGGKSVDMTADQTSSQTSDQTQVQTSVPTPITEPTSVVTQTPPVDNTKSSVYKDGTYSATGSYLSPGGPDQIDVTLVLKNDIITSASVTPEPGDRTSARYQGIFVANYMPYVVGKNIASLNLTKVSGSSLTPKGFDDALAQIKVQAKA